MLFHLVMFGVVMMMFVDVRPTRGFARMDGFDLLGRLRIAFGNLVVNVFHWIVLCGCDFLALVQYCWSRLRDVICAALVRRKVRRHF